MSLIAAPMVAFASFEFLLYAWQVFAPQTISSDCGGRAERITRAHPGRANPKPPEPIPLVI